MIESLSLLVLAIFIVATYTDVRWREVPDWVSFSGIAVGIGLHAMLALTAGTIDPILRSLGGLALGSIIGIGLYTIGQWGGGDAKLLMAAGSLLGVSLSWSNEYISFMVNLLLVGGIYGTLWTLGVAVRERKRVRAAVRSRFASRGVVIPQIALTVFGVVPLIVSILFFDEVILHVFAALLGTIPALFYFLIILFREIERLCFVKNIPLQTLTEGDWLAEDVMFAKKIICPKSNRGVTREQIHILRQHRVRTVKIKSGMPFVPAFLLAFALTLSLGNVFLIALG